MSNMKFTKIILLSFFSCLGHATEVSVSAGFSNLQFKEEYVGFFTKFSNHIISPQIGVHVEHNLFNKATLCFEFNHVLTSNDETIHIGFQTYDSKVTYWDTSLYLRGNDFSKYNLSLGLGMGFGKSEYISKSQITGELPNNFSHAMLPLIVLRAGNPDYNKHVSTFKYGTMMMGDVVDHGNGPYFEFCHKYYFSQKQLTNTKSLDHALKLKYVKWKNPMGILAGYQYTIYQDELFLGYEIRFH